ncbi:unnamed protein product [Rhizophagus irregularis]|nr:unnamed protein product [Rhizophagus irregularis]
MDFEITRTPWTSVWTLKSQVGRNTLDFGMDFEITSRKEHLGLRDTWTSIWTLKSRVGRALLTFSLFSFLGLPGLQYWF